MARMPSWIEVVSSGDGKGGYTLIVRLARRYWLRPSFWSYVIRHRQWGWPEAPSRD